MITKERNRIIQGFWIGKKLGPMEQMCVKSYLHQGHDFHLYTFEHVSDVPLGANIKDANEILLERDIYVDVFGGHVNLSNLFRYLLLYKKGGWWVDMDTVCLQPFDFEQEFVFSSEGSEPYNRYLINTTFIKSSPGASFLRGCIEFCKARGYENIHWGELGVNLFSRMVLRNKLHGYVKPPICFCPVSAHNLELLISDTNMVISSETYALHWWNEVWKLRKLEKEAEFPSGSIYGQLKNKFLLETDIR